MKNLFKIEIDENRIFGLDFLRAFAILGVVAMHGNELLPEKTRNFCTKILFFDWVGIFFVLSGFLVGGILIREIEKNGFSRKVLFKFWIRRWFRTIPAYLLVLCILVVLQLYYDPAFELKTIWQYPFFLQNFASPLPMFFPESWSLSVEEWFYLIVPILFAILFHFTGMSVRKSFWVVAVLIIFLSTIIRLFRYYHFSPSYNFFEYLFNIRLQVVSRIDGIMFGFVGALINHYYKPIFLKYKVTLALIGAFIWLAIGYARRFYPEDVALHMQSIYWWVFDCTVGSVATLFLLPLLSNWKSSKGVFYKIITLVSTISYSAYLINQTLIQSFILNLLIPWQSFTDNAEIIIILKYSLYWILVFLISIVFYKSFELPMMKLRDNARIKTILKLHTK